MYESNSPALEHSRRHIAAHGEPNEPPQLAAPYVGHYLRLVGRAHYLAWERLLQRLVSSLPALINPRVRLAQATTSGTPPTRPANVSPRRFNSPSTSLSRSRWAAR